MANKRKSLSPIKGRILVASPLVTRDEYHQTVILITKIDQYRNVQGLILNRTTGDNVSEFSIELDNFRFPVRDGGVYEQDELSVLHTKGNVIPDSRELFPGVYVDGDLDELSYWLMLGQVDLSELLFVSGYCSWTADEFATEMRRHEWYVTDATMDIVFNDRPHELWWEIVSSFGKYLHVVADNAKALSINN
jgi:putative AlgH/UPF0301 family transcriptional regulator